MAGTGGSRSVTSPSWRACDESEQARIAERLRAAGIGVITLPATDLYLMGRRDDAKRPAGAGAGEAALGRPG